MHNLFPPTHPHLHTLTYTPTPTHPHLYTRRAYEYFQSAALAGVSESYNHLGLLEMQGGLEDQGGLENQGGEHDYATALLYFESGAHMDDPDCTYNMGVMHAGMLLHVVAVGCVGVGGGKGGCMLVCCSGVCVLWCAVWWVYWNGAMVCCVLMYCVLMYCV